jgi:glycerate dehydrogenase
VIYSRGKNSVDEHSTPVSTLFSSSDVISLHCPLTAETTGFVSMALLKTMKKGAFLINTARGQLLNEHDVATALRDGILGGAALDVLSSEPPPNSNPLIHAPNCVITPHNAWYSIEARRRIMDTTVQNVHSFLKGHVRNSVISEN